MSETTAELLMYVPWLVVVMLAYTLVHSHSRGSIFRRWWLIAALFFSAVMLVVFALFLIGDDVGLEMFPDDVRVTGYSYWFGVMTIGVLIRLSKIGLAPHNNLLKDDAA